MWRSSPTYVRLAHGRQVVNPGSVGMPYGRPGAHWCLLGPGVDLRRTLFGIPSAITRPTQESAYEDMAEWADCFLNSRVGDTEAWEVFGRMEGRG